MERSFATTQFCDDVKIESNGKKIYLGLYTGDMIVPQLPFGGEKLVVIITYLTPIKNPIGIKKIRIEFPDKEPLIIDFHVDLDKPKISEENVKYLKFTVETQISPFEITKEGRIYVFIERSDGEEVYAGSLNVVKERSKVGGDSLEKLRVVNQLIQLFGELEGEAGRKRGSLATTILRTLNKTLGQPDVINPKTKMLFFQDGDNCVKVFFREPVKEKTDIFLEGPVDGPKLFVRNYNEFGFEIKTQKGKKIPTPIKIEMGKKK